MNLSAVLLVCVKSLPKFAFRTGKCNSAVRFSAKKFTALSQCKFFANRGYKKKYTALGVCCCFFRADNRGVFRQERNILWAIDTTKLEFVLVLLRAQR